MCEICRLLPVTVEPVPHILCSPFAPAVNYFDVFQMQERR